MGLHLTRAENLSSCKLATREEVMVVIEAAHESIAFRRNHNRSSICMLET